jgi:glycosyltransferase involved in cell wall biosynthesis
MIASVRANIPVGVPYEFVLCDGGSTDGTLEYLRQQPDVVLIEHGELRGAIAAFTDAGNMASGAYTVILNDDVEVQPGTLMRALVHLEDHKTCGQVAFYDDRAVPGYWQAGQFHVLHMAARRNGGESYVVYGQCCMVRTWLAKHVNWWRGHDERFTAKTYGGDNLLSAMIWELGYTVDAVEDCKVVDKVHQDDLRAINARTNDREYYDLYPNGVEIADEPQIEQQDKRRLRVLYLPIYEYGHTTQHQQKRGLREALAKRYIVQELDYVTFKDDKPGLRDALMRIMDVFQPDLMLTQLHGDDLVSAEMLATLRAYHPRLVVVNWNGDVWPHGLIAPGMLQLLRHVDLQLVVNDTVLDTYTQNGIASAYWQIGYEEPLEPLPDAPAYDVVFLGNAYSDERTELGETLRSIEGATVGIYGSGWTDAQGECTYNFTMGAALYQNAKIAIGDNQFPTQRGFVSNRLFQALAAGGALVLQQYVDGLQELTGLQADVHYIRWNTLNDLRQKIGYYLDPVNEDYRRAIADAGTRHARYFHSFDKRVQELAELIKTKAKRQPVRARALVFTGAMETGGVVGAITRKQYQFVKGSPLMVDELDAPFLVQVGQWVEYGR